MRRWLAWWYSRERFHELRRGTGILDRHQAAADLRIGRYQRHDQPETSPLGRVEANAGHDPDRRDRDRLGGNCQAARFGKDGGRLHHVGVVEHRLAHAHENHAPDRVRRVGLDLDYLVDDFPRGQISTETQPPRRAKLAGHRTAHLGTHADHVLGVSGPMQQGNADRFDRFRPLAAEKVLREPVLRRDDFVDQRQVRDGRHRPHALQHAAGNARHKVRILTRADRGNLQEPGLPRLHAQRDQAFVNLVHRQVFEGDGGLGQGTTSTRRGRASRAGPFRPATSAKAPPCGSF